VCRRCNVRSHSSLSESTRVSGLPFLSQRVDSRFWIAASLLLVCYRLFVAVHCGALSDSKTLGFQCWFRGRSQLPVGSCNSHVEGCCCRLLALLIVLGVSVLLAKCMMLVRLVVVMWHVPVVPVRMPHADVPQVCQWRLGHGHLWTIA
jgi:hypothetical protein